MPPLPTLTRTVLPVPIQYTGIATGRFMTVTAGLVITIGTGLATAATVVMALG
jgi:hypothetical protein